MIRLPLVLTLLAFLYGSTALAQQQPTQHVDPIDKTEEQRHELLVKGLKATHETNVRDIERMATLLAEVRKEMEATGERTVSVQTVRRLEEIEKLSRAIRERIKRY